AGTNTSAGPGGIRTGAKRAAHRGAHRRYAVDTGSGGGVGSQTKYNRASRCPYRRPKRTRSEDRVVAASAASSTRRDRGVAAREYPGAIWRREDIPGIPQAHWTVLRL